MCLLCERSLCQKKQGRGGGKVGGTASSSAELPQTTTVSNRPVPKLLSREFAMLQTQTLSTNDTPDQTPAITTSKRHRLALVLVHTPHPPGRLQRGQRGTRARPEPPALRPQIIPGLRHPLDQVGRGGARQPCGLEGAHPPVGRVRVGVGACDY